MTERAVDILSSDESENELTHDTGVELTTGDQKSEPVINDEETELKEAEDQKTEQLKKDDDESETESDSAEEIVVETKIKEEQVLSKDDEIPGKDEVKLEEVIKDDNVLETQDASPAILRKESVQLCKMDYSKETLSIAFSGVTDGESQDKDVHPSVFQPEYDFNEGSSDEEKESLEETEFEVLMEEVKPTPIEQIIHITPFFLDLMCSKNKDKTKKMILRGNQLINTLKRRLRDSDMKIICEYLKRNKSITYLDLSYNLITSEGIVLYLVPLLKEDVSLKELVLSNNEITLKGLKSLANVASDLRLTTLILNGNKLGPKSGEDLAKLIENSRYLIHLDVSQTDQTVSSLACLAAILNKDYIPCCVNRFPFFRHPPNPADKEPKAEAKQCSPSNLALYVRQLVTNEKEKDKSDSSVSSSMKYKFQRDSIADLRIPGEEKLSVSSISDTTFEEYIEKTEGEKKDIERRRVMKASLVDVRLPSEHAIKIKGREVYFCCRVCKSTQLPHKCYMGQLHASTSIADISLPPKLCLEEHIDSRKQKHIEVKRDHCNRIIKPSKSFQDLISLGKEILKASLVNVNIPPERGEALCSNEMPEPPANLCESSYNLLRDSISTSSNDMSDVSNYRRKPILKILFLDRILGHHYCQPLTYHFARILSQMIKNNDSLIELHLEKNGLADNDIEVICQGLKHNTTLKLLDLSANQITSLGVFHLAEILPQTNLEALVLNHNNISDYGARCLYFAMPSTNLKMLDIAYNKITDLGMMYILFTMKKTPKILTLFIWGNPITNTSLVKIKEYLVQGWLLTDSLDIKIYEVDNVLHHGLRSADSFKASYYMLPRKHDPPVEPPQAHGLPLKFEYYDAVYPRLISKSIPHKTTYPPNQSKSCAT